MLPAKEADFCTICTVLCPARLSAPSGSGARRDEAKKNKKHKNTNTNTNAAFELRTDNRHPNVQNFGEITMYIGKDLESLNSLNCLYNDKWFFETVCISMS